MSLKAKAQAILERNRVCNQSATSAPETVQLNPPETGLKVARVTGAAAEIVLQAVDGLAITPDQFLALCSPDDLAAIEGGQFDAAFLRGYARSFEDGIASGRIAFHPASGALVRHGVCEKDQEAG